MSIPIIPMGTNLKESAKGPIKLFGLTLILFSATLLHVPSLLLRTQQTLLLHSWASSDTQRGSVLEARPQKVDLRRLQETVAAGKREQMLGCSLSRAYVPLFSNAIGIEPRFPGHVLQQNSGQGTSTAALWDARVCAWMPTADFAALPALQDEHKSQTKTHNNMRMPNTMKRPHR